MSKKEFANLNIYHPNNSYIIKTKEGYVAKEHIDRDFVLISNKHKAYCFDGMVWVNRAIKEHSWEDIEIIKI